MSVGSFCMHVHTGECGVAWTSAIERRVEISPVKRTMTCATFDGRVERGNYVFGTSSSKC